MKCKNCQIEYEAKRKTSQFCSPKCRKEYWSKNAKQVSVQKNGKVSVPVDSVPKTEEKPLWTVGFCRWCGKKITPEEYGQKNWHLVECCYECVAKRNP